MVPSPSPQPNFPCESCVSIPILVFMSYVAHFLGESELLVFTSFCCMVSTLISMQNELGGLKLRYLYPLTFCWDFRLISAELQSIHPRLHEFRYVADECIRAVRCLWSILSSCLSAPMCISTRMSFSRMLQFASSTHTVLVVAFPQGDKTFWQLHCCIFPTFPHRVEDCILP